MQDWIVARQQWHKGIAEVVSFGGKLKQYEVAVNPNRLKAMGVSIPDIFTALEKTIRILAEHILTKTKCLFYPWSRFGYFLGRCKKYCRKNHRRYSYFY